MLVVAVMGLVFNVVQMWILHQPDGHYQLRGVDDTNEKSEEEELTNLRENLIAQEE